MIVIVAAAALVAVLVFGVLLLIRRPANAHRVARWGGLVIVVLVGAALAPLTVDDSGSAAVYLLGVPVLAAVVAVLAERFLGRHAGIADVIAGLLVGGWGLLLALGIGAAFLPVAMLYLASGLRSLTSGPSTVS